MRKQQIGLGSRWMYSADLIKADPRIAGVWTVVYVSQFMVTFHQGADECSQTPEYVSTCMCQVGSGSTPDLRLEDAL